MSNFKHFSLSVPAGARVQDLAETYSIRTAVFIVIIAEDRDSAARHLARFYATQIGGIPVGQIKFSIDDKRAQRILGTVLMAQEMCGSVSLDCVVAVEDNIGEHENHRNIELWCVAHEGERQRVGYETTNAAAGIHIGTISSAVLDHF